MISEKRRVLDWLYRQEFPPVQLDYDEVLIDAAEEALSKTRIDAEAYAAANSSRHWNWLRQEIDQDMKRGLQPIFNFPNALSRRMHWCATDFSQSLSSKQKSKIALLQSRPSILRTIDVLTNREYEALGCVASQILGAKHVFLTQAGNEGGVDFFSSICVQGASHIFSGSSCTLRIVGQSKLYSEKVQVDRVKEFITTLTYLKNRNPITERHVPSWFRQAQGPVIGWMIAHNGFQSGAELSAQDYGVILSDSRDMTEMLSLSHRLFNLPTNQSRADWLQLAVADVLQKFS